MERDALDQVACGAMVLDLNAGVVCNSNPNPNETEPPLMRRMIELVQRLVDGPLCNDSSVPAALEAGLAAATGRPLLNSVTGEEERLEASCRWSGNTTCRSRRPAPHAPAAAGDAPYGSEQGQPCRRDDQELNIQSDTPLSRAAQMWCDLQFSSRAALSGGVIRRKAREVDRVDGRTQPERGVARPGDRLKRTGKQYAILSNLGDQTFIC